MIFIYFLAGIVLGIILFIKMQNRDKIAAKVIQLVKADDSLNLVEYIKSIKDADVTPDGKRKMLNFLLDRLSYRNIKNSRVDQILLHFVQNIRADILIDKSLIVNKIYAYQDIKETCIFFYYLVNILESGPVNYPIRLDYGSTKHGIAYIDVTCLQSGLDGFKRIEISIHIDKREDRADFKQMMDRLEEKRVADLERYKELVQQQNISVSISNSLSYTGY